MFVLSVKTSRKQLVWIAVCAVALITSIVLLACLPEKQVTADVLSKKAATDEQRREYLSQLGYECGKQKAEVKEILIPDEFDTVFRRYNDLQKAAGMDLYPFHGKRVKCYTYTVTNYPDEKNVLAHVYVANEEVIGGDISSSALNGFMHGLQSRPDNAETASTTAASTAASQTQKNTTATKKANS